MRTVFFGTPHFAVPTLDALVAAGLAPALVVSQPARPVGRGRRTVAPPVVEAAERHGLDVAQPEQVRDEVFLADLAALEPDVAVVVAYGQIFRRRLLDLPRLGCVNLHASLLPRWRGAAPIQAAIAHGDARTGVTTMQMTAGLDSGPILLQEAVDVAASETAPQLAARLAAIGGRLMARTLEGLDAGNLAGRAQDESAVTLAPRLTKADGDVDWRLAAGTIHDRWRAYQPWPGTSAVIGGRPLKLVRLRPASAAADAKAERPPPGTILGIAGDAVQVACGGDSVLTLLEVQRPSRAAIGAAAWLNGERLGAGDRFASQGLSSQSEA